VSAALAATGRASSFTLNGSLTNGPQSITLHLTLSTRGGSKGTLTLDGQAIRLVEVAGTVFFSAGASFWKQQGSDAAAQLFTGRWVAAPATDATFSTLAPFLDLQKLTAQLLPPSSRGDLHKGGLTRVAGHKVIAIRGRDPKDGSSGTLYVATTGDPFVIRLSGTGGSSGTGLVTFSGYGAPVHVRPPANPINYDQLTGGRSA
jgi:hypothetical protein